MGAGLSLVAVSAEEARDPLTSPERPRWLVTCSCSGLVSLETFEECVIKGVHRLNRRLQFFDRTGPGIDHPIYSNCPESRYLKVLWARMT